jgi:hypothetical protein
MSNELSKPSQPKGWSDTPLVIIPGSLNEHTLARDLVERGNVDRAIVMWHDLVSFEAWRVSLTSYAWRSSAMSAPAFGVIQPDTRLDVNGMPRWEWDLYGYRFDGSIHDQPKARKAAHL